MINVRINLNHTITLSCMFATFISYWYDIVFLSKVCLCVVLLICTVYIQQSDL